ncbi:MAG TPA: Flp pilus assembly protein CpaB [Gammaproteobacteria bacterium]|nr:Flp pilus assembly protein CpaB [Gammaproteobacteria bacterium]
MIKRRVFSMFAIALLLGLGAAWMANGWIQARIQPAEAGDAATVVVAALEVPFGTKIESSHIRTAEWPVGSVPEGAFNDPAEVEGKIAKQAFFPGEILLEGRIAEHLGGSTLSAIIEPTKRAITVRVNDVIGVAGFLLPGNRIDVLATRKEGKRAQTRTVLEDIKVLAVDQTASPEKDKPVVVRAVTLEMAPEEAEILVKSTQEGTLQLTLRNPLDNEPILAKKKPESKPVKRVARAGNYGSDVTIIRGVDVKTTNVKQ